MCAIQSPHDCYERRLAGAKDGEITHAVQQRMASQGRTAENDLDVIVSRTHQTDKASHEAC